MSLQQSAMVEVFLFSIEYSDGDIRIEPKGREGVSHPVIGRRNPRWFNKFSVWQKPPQCCKVISLQLK